MTLRKFPIPIQEATSHQLSSDQFIYQVFRGSSSLKIHGVRSSHPKPEAAGVGYNRERDDISYLSVWGLKWKLRLMGRESATIVYLRGVVQLSYRSVPPTCHCATHLIFSWPHTLALCGLHDLGSYPHQQRGTIIWNQSASSASSSRPSCSDVLVHPALYTSLVSWDEIWNIKSSIVQPTIQ